MNKTARSFEINMIISTILTLILGIILIIAPEESLKLITILIAFILFIIGIIQVYDYIKKPSEERINSISLILGIILICIGIFLYIRNEALVKFITSIIGLVVVIKSLFKIQYAFNIKSISKKWIYNLIVGLISLIVGLFLLINPFRSAEIFLKIIGIVLVIGSILELIETYLVLHSLKDSKELNYVEKQKEDK